MKKNSMLPAAKDGPKEDNSKDEKAKNGAAEAS